jgi:hypothetical protein
MRSVGTRALLCLPLPGHEVGGSGIKETVGDEAKDDDGEAIHKEPITNTARLFSACVEHGRDDHESGGDSTFTDPEEKTNGKETTERGTSSMATEDDCPEEDIDAHPLANGKALEGEILRVLEEEVTKVEDGTEPVELGGIQVSARLDAEDGCFAEGGLVHESDPLGGGRDEDGSRKEDIQVHDAHEGHDVPVDLAPETECLVRVEGDMCAGSEGCGRVDVRGVVGGGDVFFG